MMKIGAGVMLLLLAVSACSDDGTGPGGGPPPGDRLEGASGGLASTAIPRLAYEPRLEDYRQALALVEAQLGSLPVIVTAAGNESNTAVGTQPASYLSDFNNAGLVQGAANIIVVEALDLEAGVATRSPSSNVGGHVSAPGGGILSTIPTNTYAFSDGTSYAAPHVAGLAGYLYALDPTLPRATLSSNAVRTLILATAVPALGGASARMDAFAAAVALDSVNGNDRVLRLLADLDDGTADGNTRVNADGSVNTAESQFELFR